MTETWHGTPYGYHTKRCRCRPCTAAMSAQCKERRAARAKQGVPDDAHGKASTYQNWGCHCRPCKDAHADSMHDYRTRKAQRS